MDMMSATPPSSFGAPIFLSRFSLCPKTCPVPDDRIENQRRDCRPNHRIEAQQRSAESSTADLDGFPEAAAYSHSWSAVGVQGDALNVQAKKGSCGEGKEGRCANLVPKLVLGSHL